MADFKPILKRALRRKDGEQGLELWVLEPMPMATFISQPDHRFLSMMTKVIFQAGFVWRVIENKWPDFETVFLGFDTEKMMLLSPEQWEKIGTDKRIVRNMQKIISVPQNATYIDDQSREYGSYAAFLQQWPQEDLIGLYRHLKQAGCRLGGMSGPRILRQMGLDTFMLSTDVVMCLQDAGLDIADQPSNKRDLTKVQDCFNSWRQQTGFSFTRLSRICASSIGQNYAPKART
ncbi:MAG: DNA-3-methyladenine glycosylase I [Oceanospirillaceae bacterium]|jgi:3-methyladenine DNA glycosylase Tag|nr:DNA-3-methyladenine glycosylase I [Oceanospirillaceae bacterium]MBT7673969.1 DNA-3-methyladenine glycosylase I [Oceanospirillaceae bacterium]